VVLPFRFGTLAHYSFFWITFETLGSILAAHFVVCGSPFSCRRASRFSFFFQRRENGAQVKDLLLDLHLWSYWMGENLHNVGRGSTGILLRYSLWFFHHPQILRSIELKPDAHLFDCGQACFQEFFGLILILIMFHRSIVAFHYLWAKCGVDAVTIFDLSNQMRRVATPVSKDSGLVNWWK